MAPTYSAIVRCPLTAVEFQSKWMFLCLRFVLRQPNLLRPRRKGAYILTHGTACLRVIPTHLMLHHGRRNWRSRHCRLPAKELQAGAPREHVIECCRHLVTCAVGNLGADRGISVDQWQS